MSNADLEENMAALTRRYRADPEALRAVLCPILVPIHTLDKHIFVAPGERHLRATFQVAISDANRSVLVRGRTGKFVPGSYGSGEPGWKELAKGRIISVDAAAGVATGEIYLGFGGTNRDKLQAALDVLSTDDFLEIDQYGAAAKVLSGLAEHYLVRNLQSSGYTVTRMPEDMAAHLGVYANFDFTLEKDGVVKTLEVKSLWGTNTDYARLIHSRTTRPDGDPSTWTAGQRANYYPTSSCKFATQNFFAVSLFLRTGNIEDFAFARSTPRTPATPHGLPAANGYPEHVCQNPLCQVGDGAWFGSLDEVWNLP